MMGFKHGERVSVLLLGENSKEVLYGQLEGMKQELSGRDDFLKRETEIIVEINLLSNQGTIEEDREITEAILKHNLRVESIQLHDEICKQKKELEEIQEKTNRMEIRYREMHEKLKEVIGLTKKANGLLHIDEGHWLW